MTKSFFSRLWAGRSLPFYAKVPTSLAEPESPAVLHRGICPYNGSGAYPPAEINLASLQTERVLSLLVQPGFWPFLALEVYCNFQLTVPQQHSDLPGSLSPTIVRHGCAWHLAPIKLGVLLLSTRVLDNDAIIVADFNAHMIIRRFILGC
jgi:hypothetical protein